MKQEPSQIAEHSNLTLSKSGKYHLFDAQPSFGLIGQHQDTQPCPHNGLAPLAPLNGRPRENRQNFERIPPHAKLRQKAKRQKAKADHQLIWWLKAKAPKALVALYCSRRSSCDRLKSKSHLPQRRHCGIKYEVHLCVNRTSPLLSLDRVEVFTRTCKVDVLRKVPGIRRWT